MTLLRGFDVKDLPDLVKIVGRLMIPEGWEYLSRCDGESNTSPAVVVLKLDVHMDKVGPASIKKFAQRVAEAMEGGLPAILLVPDDVTLPAELRLVLPDPILLAPLSREILLAALDAWHPDADVMADTSLPHRLPTDAGITNLSPLGLRLALAAPDLETAIARLAQSDPKPIPCGPHLDQIAEDNPALPAARRIVADLKGWQASQVAWSDLTRSMLLYGPPGTGKTWLAEAMAASAGINHVSGSFAQWQAAGHLGNMLDEMRRCFAQAFAMAPAILTIDEIDAVGSRSDADTHASNYRRQVINGFLEQMDQISRKEGVIVIGTCNHPERIDPAILRAGRFDLHIEIGRPSPASLAQLLRSKLGSSFDAAAITALARAASGCTPAQVDAAIRLGRSACRSEGRALLLDDIRSALALPPPNAALDWRIAVHEAGHAVVCAALGLGEISRITLTQRGGEIERRPVAHQMLHDNYQHEISYLLGGRAAEQLVLGSISAGAGGGADSDLGQATARAIAIETCMGIGAQGPLWSRATAIEDVHRDVRTLVAQRLVDAEMQAMRILGEHQTVLISLAKRLDRDRHLTGVELETFLRPITEGGDLTDHRGRVPNSG